MSYDEFFIDGDKPYAENLNDSILVSNALGFKVNVEAPTGFSTGTWIDTTLKRKCNVCTIRLNNKLPTGVTINGDGELNFTGSKTIDLYVYPNFNLFEKWAKISWESSNNNLEIDLLTKNGDLIFKNVTNGNNLNNHPELQKLDEIIIRLRSIDNVIINKLQFEFNKKGSSLSESSLRLTGYSTTEEMNTAINLATVNKADVSVVDNKVDKISGKGLSTNDYTNTEKQKLATLHNFDDSEVKSLINEKQDIVTTETASGTYYRAYKKLGIVSVYMNRQNYSPSKNTWVTLGNLPSDFAPYDTIMMEYNQLRVMITYDGAIQINTDHTPINIQFNVTYIR